MRTAEIASIRSLTTPSQTRRKSRPTSWGRALRLAFATDPKPFAAMARDERKPAHVRIATFRSAGEDGAFETPDDIVWRGMADGTTSE